MVNKIQDKHNYKTILRDNFHLLIVGIFYYIACNISLLFPGTATVIALIWPAAGLGLGVLLLFPKSKWLLIILIIFLSGILANISHRTFLASIGFMTTNVLESFLSAWFITKINGEYVKFTKVKEIISLLVAVFFINSFTAILGATIATITNKDPFYTAWLTWVIADGFGMMLMTPFVVTIISLIRFKKKWKYSLIIEWIFAFALLSILSGQLFFGGGDIAEQYLKPYMLFPLIIWIALRFQLTGIAFANVLTFTLAITGNHDVLGWNNNLSSTDKILAIQLFMTVLVGTGLFTVTLLVERKKAEIEMLESRNKYSIMMNESPTAIVVYDKNAMFSNANNAFFDLFGVKNKASMAGVSLWDFTATRERKAELLKNKIVRFEGLYDFQQMKDLKVLNTTKSGKLGFDIIVVPINDIDGINAGYMLQVRDITEAKEAQQKLELSEDKFRSLFESLTQGIAILEVLSNVEGSGNDFLVKDVNQAFVNMTNIDSKKVIGFKMSELSSLKLSDWVERLNVVVKEKKSISFENYNPNLNKNFLVYVFMSNFNQIALLISDITIAKKADSVKEKLIAEIHKSNDELEAFAHTISHDLKSPLTTIRGFSDLIRQQTATKDSEGVMKSLKYISDASNAMKLLLENISLLSNIPKYLNNRISVFIPNLIEQVSNILAIDILNNKVKVIVTDELKNPHNDLSYIYCMYSQVLQLILNIFSNAIKFKKENEPMVIEIGIASNRGKDPCYYIKDNGIGIENTYLDKVFGLFERLDKSIDGTGVGLSIAQRVVELHGGRIWAESKGLGKGTTIYFILPKLK